LKGEFSTLLDIKNDFPGYPTTGVYLDSSTLNLQPNTAIDAQSDYIRDVATTVRKGLHKRSRKSENVYLKSKGTISSFLGGSTENYAWIPNADYGWNLILNLYREKWIGKKIKVITSIFEHHSLLAPLVHLQNIGAIEIQYLRTEDEYNLENCITLTANEDTIIALGHVSPLVGLYRDITGITKCAKSMGATTIIDFSRSAGQQLPDLANVDSGIFDGSTDLLGPQATGLLYMSDQLLETDLNPFPGSGGVRYVTTEKLGQIRGIERFETGNPNMAGLIGLATGITYLSQIGRKKITQHRIAIQNYLISCLNELDDISIIDPLMDTKMGNLNRASIVCFNLGEISSHDIALLLDESSNIAVRSGLLCTHPGMTEMALEGVVQVSTHIYNSKQDIDQLLDGLKTVQSVFL
jgi:cysteine desulfurase/selenocysteine lyase